MTAHVWVAVLSTAVVGLAVAVIVLNHQRLVWKRDDLYRIEWQRRHYSGTGASEHDAYMRQVRNG